MPRTHRLGDYIGRESVYLLFDETRCLYVGDSRNGRAGVASRITQHLANAHNTNNPVGNLHLEMNAKDRPQNWYLDWRLEVYSLSECQQKTGKYLRTIKEAQAAMIELLNPTCNVQRR